MGVHPLRLGLQVLANLAVVDNAVFVVVALALALKAIISAKIPPEASSGRASGRALTLEAPSSSNAKTITDMIKEALCEDVRTDKKTK